MVSNFSTFRALISIKRFSSHYFLIRQTKLHIRIAVLAVCWRDIIAVFFKIFQRLSKGSEFFFKRRYTTVEKDDCQKISHDSAANITGNGRAKTIYKPFIHVRTPFFFSFLFGSPNAFFKESQLE